MTLPFADSAQSTLGIEWELALVDAVSGELRSEAPDLLRALHVTEGLAEDDVNPHMTSELLQNTVELVTGVHERVDAATADLGRIDADLGGEQVDGALDGGGRLRPPGAAIGVHGHRVGEHGLHLGVDHGRRIHARE